MLDIAIDIIINKSWSLEKNEEENEINLVQISGKRETKIVIFQNPSFRPVIMIQKVVGDIQVLLEAPIARNNPPSINSIQKQMAVINVKNFSPEFQVFPFLNKIALLFNVLFYPPSFFKECQENLYY